ncbi:MAG TPA: tRNA pseudouridine(38-40) synthase TruA [Beijerinckiaceae bacterium]|nr:tRNA pseudouridine(38-40) synthase TruA [Beijerinckiaceae bacterium]
MPRYKVILEYDGAPYAGWQLQAGWRTVQGDLEEAVRQFAGENARVNGCGRTDAGVHALAQVAHIDLTRDWRTDTVRDALNAKLKLIDARVAVLHAEHVDERFDARFSARRRHYLYRILNRRPPSPLLADYTWHVPRKLDVTAMNAAATVLVGHHDFSTFRAANCQARSPEKTLEFLHVEHRGDEVEVATHARSFLHHQVRSMVGSLVEVGLGRWSREDLERARDARRRDACGPTAPAHGLYFVKVDY